MVNYYLNLNAQSNGDHEIHKVPCYYYYRYKSGFNFELLGAFQSEVDAANYAKRRHPDFKIDGCSYCCPIIHKH